MNHMAHERMRLGQRGELLAAETLARHGFMVIARNWRCPAGEADLVAERGGEWYFFEVRTRRGAAHGLPEESLTPVKRARMEAVARHYLSDQSNAAELSWHLGFVAVALDATGRLLRITLYPDLAGEPLLDSRQP